MFLRIVHFYLQIPGICLKVRYLLFRQSRKTIDRRRRYLKIGTHFFYCLSLKMSGYVLTTEPSTEVLQFDKKSVSRLSCLRTPPTAIVLTSKIAESSMPFSPKASTSVSEEVIIFKLSSNTAFTTLRHNAQHYAKHEFLTHIDRSYLKKKERRGELGVKLSITIMSCH